MKIQNLRTSPKQKERKPTSKISKTHQVSPLVTQLPPLFFGTMRHFLIIFGLQQKFPLHLFRYSATQWLSKIPKGPFRHCDTVQKPHFFRKLFKVFKGSPFKFFHVLQPAGVSQSPKGPSFTIWDLDIAPTLADPGLFFYGSNSN